jgi:hypothetical protein
MIRHFFLDKAATIIKGSKANTGLNPILSLTYGKDISRGLLHFGVDEIAAWINENGIDVNDLEFRLHLTNCFSIDGVPYEQEILHASKNISYRAVSFDLDIFKLDNEFDAGRGYEYASDMWVGQQKSYSEFGANWFQYATGKSWKVRGAYEEKNKIATIHFDNGKENINIDITDYVKGALGGKNPGLGIKFSDDLEKEQIDAQQYVGFFTDKTNTFYHPYIEVIYKNIISDSRESFYREKENKLYLYANAERGPLKLDENPTCEINGTKYETKAAYNGVYFATIPADSITANPETILYDKWSNIKLNGVTLDDVELEFVVLPYQRFVQIGDKSAFKNMTVPSVFGIDDSEVLGRGEIREVTVDFRKKYTTNRKDLIDLAEYRIYVKDARREYTVFDYQPVEKAFLNNFFILYTKDLIPNEYFVDIRVRDGHDLRYFKNVLHFYIKDDITEKYV